MYPTFSSVCAVGGGAILGAWLRWWFGIVLNPLFPTLPLGTLAANLVGGYFIGIAIAYFGRHPEIPPEFRLFIITGMMGALTTFSTFSAEAVTLIIRAQYFWAATHMLSHLAGSVIMTIWGMMTIQGFRP